MEPPIASITGFLPVILQIIMFMYVEMVKHGVFIFSFVDILQQLTVQYTKQLQIIKILWLKNIIVRLNYKFSQTAKNNVISLSFGLIQRTKDQDCVSFGDLLQVRSIEAVIARSKATKRSVAKFPHRGLQQMASLRSP